MNRMDWRARFLRSGKRGRAVYGRKTRANEQERTAAIVLGRVLYPPRPISRPAGFLASAVNGTRFRVNKIINKPREGEGTGLGFRPRVSKTPPCIDSTPSYEIDGRTEAEKVKKRERERERRKKETERKTRIHIEEWIYREEGDKSNGTLTFRYSIRVSSRFTIHDDHVLERGRVNKTCLRYDF